MYGDFSRMTYSPAKAYTGVWSQQGRVHLDADANEQTAILLDWLRTLAVDFIGPFGGHITRAGFLVKLDGTDLTFTPGHYYVYGLRCESLETAAPKVSVANDKPPYLVQLLVWERSVSAVVDPDLLEPALGPYPPDTTVRTQVAWVPAVSMTLPDGTPLDQIDNKKLNAEYITGRFEEYHADRVYPQLAARVDRDVQTEEASIVPTTSGYLGVENQLYRVEVHAGGTAGGVSRATFKWSRDNGSVEFRIVAIPDDETDDRTKTATPVVKVTVASLGRDERTGLDVGDWVELVNNNWAPQDPPQPLLSVQAIDRAYRIVTLGEGPKIDLSLHPYLRRWDQTADSPGSPDGTPIVEMDAGKPEGWLPLEDGVQVRFSPTGAHYQRGDHWLIPARTATGGLLWPGDADPRAVPPHGPARYLVPLALILDDKGTSTVEDMRTLFTHLAFPPESEDPGGGNQA
jgi:hypothetical protein